MPPGKIFNATAIASRRKSYRRRRATGFRKSVAKIAKSVVMRQSETKTAAVGWTQAFGTNGRFDSIWKNIVKGDDQSQRDGDRIKALGFKLRGYLTCDDTVVTAKQDTIACRMLVVTSKRPLSTITDANVSYNSSIDPELLNVHYDRYVNFNLDGRTRWFNKYFKIPRTVMYEGNGVTRGETYVILIPYAALGGTGLTTTAGLYLNTTVQLYYKDF